MVQWILVILNIVSFLFIIGKMIGKNKDKIGKYASKFRSHKWSRKIFGGKDDTVDEKDFEMAPNTFDSLTSSSRESSPFESTTVNSYVVNPMHQAMDRHSSTKTSSPYTVNPMHALKKGKKTKDYRPSSKAKKTSTSSLTLSKKPSNTDVSFQL